MALPDQLIKKTINLVKRMDLHADQISPEEKQIRTLRHLIDKSAKTAFGKHYGFSNLERQEDLIQAFQMSVPMHDYEQIHDRWWYRCLEGEKNVCWKGTIRYFAMSSGTTGASSKYIPVSREMLQSMRLTALRMLASLPKFKLPLRYYPKDWLMIGSSATLKDYQHYFAGDLSGINASKPPLWVRSFYKPGVKIAKLPSWEERALQIAKKAPQWDVSFVAGIPSWVQLTLEKVIQYHRLSHIHEIWPNFKVFVSGGIALEPYRKSLEALLDKEIIYMDSYLASEGFFAFQPRPSTESMALQLQNGIFYEFIPFDDNHFNEYGQPLKDITPLSIEGVAEGIDYALVISTCAGAWRYLIGDTIKFTDLKRRELIITGRTKHFLSFCGEHVSVDNLNQAILSAEKELNSPIMEFTVGGEKSGTHYRHHWYIASDEAVDRAKLQLILDSALKKVNDDYSFERNAMLDEPHITLISNQLFYKWQDSHGRLNGQSKIPRVMKGKQWEEFQAFIEERLPTFAKLR